MADKWGRINIEPETHPNEDTTGEGMVKHYGTHDAGIETQPEAEPSEQSKEDGQV